MFNRVETFFQENLYNFRQKRIEDEDCSVNANDVTIPIQLESIFN